MSKSRNERELEI